MPTSKACSKCGDTKPLTEFSPDNRKPSGLRSWCNRCSSDQYRRWRLANPERVRDYHRRYRQAKKARNAE